MKLKETIGYECTDGKKFFSKGEALFHQSKIDVIKKVQKSGFILTSKTEVSDLEVTDLSIICELADIIRQSEK